MVCTYGKIVSKVRFLFCGVKIMGEPLFNSKHFFTELARYYMEFLESDFSSRSLPSRKISMDSETELSLTEYPDLNETALSILFNNFQSNSFENIHRDTAVVKIPSGIIDEASKDLEHDPINFPKIEKLINRELRKHKLPGKFHFSGLFDEIDKPDKEDVELFLSNYQLSGFFDDIYELWKSKLMTEKHEFYLYFFDISFENQSYPIFFMPITINRSDEGSFSFEYDPVLLINKKAIEHVTNMFAEEQQKQWRVELPPRHIYISNYNTKELVSFLQNIINEITNFIGLKPMDLFKSTNSYVKINQDKYTISNCCYLALADKSDESLLNDYEELLTLFHSGENSEATEVFEKISTEFLFENPKSYARKIQDHYENQKASEKLSYTSPVPLNREQLEVLKAIDTEGCDRIVIEGPPGTGKSHTITAIIFNALLNGKSVLMVSDKKEALDVVEDKINSVLDKMKLDDFVQNPILRLGKKDTNFTGIFKVANYDKIKMRHGAFRRHREQIESEIETIHGDISTTIEKEIDTQFFLHSDQVKNYVSFEEVFRNRWEKRLNLEELGDGIKPEFLYDLWKHTFKFMNISNQLVETCHLHFNFESLTLTQLKIKINDMLKDLSVIEERLTKEHISFLLVKEIDKRKVSVLEKTLIRLRELKKPIIGYLFSGNKIKELEQEFFNVFYKINRFSLVDKQDILHKELQIYKNCLMVEEKWMSEVIDLFHLIRDGRVKSLNITLEDLRSEIEGIHATKKKIPLSVEMLELESDLSQHKSLVKFAQFEEEEIKKLVHYLQTYFHLNQDGGIPANLYVEQRNELEKRLILKMTNILDNSVVEFRDNYRNDAEELKKVFRAKKKIPKHLLERLVNAFPCLIVGIRELGEFIPLEANLFDLVIIDEASQVSIAQAFPAIIRGKKTVVLGDTKQFSNVKSHNASTKMNNMLFNRVRDAYKKDIAHTTDSIKESLELKIENFNIKNSILDFMKNITNFECSLKKHFRGYIELINYSNHNFYSDSLQVMKIRGNSIKDVIQFHIVAVDERMERVKNTNSDEANFIINELKGLKQCNYQGTVGIITPFTNQQKLLQSKILASPDWEYYKSKFNLKVMTFDSCQGEERDIIYYTMVEKPDEDSLKYIFPVTLNKVAEEEDGTLKAQRLNVGFSRAKESIRFVMSKEPDTVQHETGRVLKSFKQLLETQDLSQVIKKTDSRSKMEPIVVNMIQQTRFYQERRNNIELIPQFDIGRYIKQLDPLAKIPDYRTDFLMIFKTKNEKTQMVIIEYDGYEYHFEQSSMVNEFNYDRFYVESDVERQKTIESYGYPFVRLNKFVIRDNPIRFLDRQFARCFNISDNPLEDDLRNVVADTYDKIESKQIKKCPKCEELKDLDEFYDPKLTSLYGRYCNNCKRKKR